MNKLLIVDDDTGISRTLQLHYQSQSYAVEVAHCVDDGVEIAKSFQPNVIILDIRMEGKSGIEGIPDFKAICPESRIIMITAFHDMDSTIQAMQQGADEYIHSQSILMSLITPSLLHLNITLPINKMRSLFQKRSGILLSVHPMR